MLEDFVRGFISDFFAEGRRILVEDFISVLPDVVGYTAIVCGAFIVICPLINRSILQPLGIFAAVGIGAASILGAT